MSRRDRDERCNVYVLTISPAVSIAGVTCVILQPLGGLFLSRALVLLASVALFCSTCYFGVVLSRYVARISDRVSTRELEDLFSKYGRIRDIHIKSDFGFILYEDDRDASDAIYYLDGYELDGKRLIVERKKGLGMVILVLLWLWLCGLFLLNCVGRGNFHVRFWGGRCRFCIRGVAWRPGFEVSGPRDRDRDRDRGDDKGAGRCFNCGKEGHWARDCKDGDWTYVHPITGDFFFACSDAMPRNTMYKTEKGGSYML